ncbi:MAG: peroxidase-related enzyme [Variovorax sp.]
MTSSSPFDVIDHAVPLTASQATHAVRHQRTKVVAATQGSYEGLFTPGIEGISVVERLLTAFHACRLSKADSLAAHYRERLVAEKADAALIAAVEAGRIAAIDDARIVAMLGFTTKLIERPIEGDRDAVQTLVKAGLSTPAIVALAQLIAFLSYQVRVVAGLKAMAAAEGAASGARPPEGAQHRSPEGGGLPRPDIININGFTNQVLDWASWLETVKLEEATPEQIAALDEMSPTAKQSAYFLLLAHQPEILLQRSIAFNAIMFAPGGMPRAERELGATVESRINGCVYCTSVHAQRFEQLAKRRDVIEQVFEDPATAGTTEREKAIVQFSAELTLRPDALSAEHVQPLKAVGLTDIEVLDLVHSVALFAWANRLMLNLGEPIFPAPAAA